MNHQRANCVVLHFADEWIIRKLCCCFCCFFSKQFLNHHLKDMVVNYNKNIHEFSLHALRLFIGNSFLFEFMRTTTFIDTYFWASLISNCCHWLFFWARLYLFCCWKHYEPLRCFRIKFTLFWNFLAFYKDFRAFSQKVGVAVSFLLICNIYVQQKFIENTPLEMR